MFNVIKLLTDFSSLNFYTFKLFRIIPKILCTQYNCEQKKIFLLPQFFPAYEFARENNFDFCLLFQNWKDFVEKFASMKLHKNVGILICYKQYNDTLIPRIAFCPIKSNKNCNNYNKSCIKNICNVPMPYIIFLFILLLIFLFCFIRI